MDGGIKQGIISKGNKIITYLLTCTPQQTPYRYKLLPKVI